MVFTERNPGLWDLRLEVGDHFGAKKEDAFIVFAGPDVSEYNKLLTVEAGLAAEAPDGILIEFKDEKGEIEKRKVSPDAIEKRNKFLSDLLSKKIKDHNFFMKNGEAEKRLDNKEVWAWIMERPDLNSMIIEEYRSKIPLAKGKEQKQQ